MQNALSTLRETQACLIATGEASLRIDFSTGIRSSSAKGTEERNIAQGCVPRFQDSKFQIRINDPRLLGPWYTQGTDESSNRLDSQISSFDTEWSKQSWIIHPDSN